MSSDTKPPPSPAPRPRRKTSLFARGEPLVWLTGGTLVLCLFMIVGLLFIVFNKGLRTFWPGPVVQITTPEGEVLLGEVTRDETYFPEEEALATLSEKTRASATKLLARTGGESERRLIRTENFELTGVHFRWVSDFAVVEETRPEWAVVLERSAGGRFYGIPKAFREDGVDVTTDPAEIWERYEGTIDAVRDRNDERREIEEDEIGALSERREEARLRVRDTELEHGKGSAEHEEAIAEQKKVEENCLREEVGINGRIAALVAENARYEMVLTTCTGQEKVQPLADIVRGYLPNQTGFFGRLGIYLSRWWEFLTEEPREANSEGGVFPAIFGTVVMTLLMTIFVVPFGVLAALYLREYAKQGAVVSAVRIAINNLAGVPSIVYGVFGFGFFCYILGASIDQMFYESNLPNPTFGTGGVLWASITLALLTLPVVIVATEEALSAVPGSMREGSYACGASKWQTIKRIVLPRAMPGIMTGMILAMARGAGEVAPLMLVGAVKSAPELPVDMGDWSGSIAFLPTGPIHANRSFMHLGFHIYDVGFQSQNSEAARPLVFTTTLLLILIVLSLNLTAVWVRGRLRRKFASDKF